MLVAVLSSCGKQIIDPVPENDEDPGKDTPVLSKDSVFVSLKASLDFSEEPLTKSGSQDDLYGIRVYQLVYSERDECWYPEIVAYGTFDDLEKAVVKMAKSFNYGIDITFVPDGKNLVYSDSKGHYGAPFDPVWTENGDLNTMMYYNASYGGGKPVGLNTGNVQDKNNTDGGLQASSWPTITRYQGSAICNPAKEESVNVKLFSQMIGFRISISDFESGSVYLSGTFGQKIYATRNNDGSGLLDTVVCMEYMPSIEWLGNYRYSGSIEGILDFLKDKMNYQGVSLIYSDSDGSEVTLYNNPYFITTRNTRYTMSFSLSDAIRNGGITAEVVDEGDMTESPFTM